MLRAVLAVTSVVAATLAIWLYLDNRELRAKLAAAPQASNAGSATEKVAVAPPADPWTAPTPSASGSAKRDAPPLPTLTPEKDETRLERRQRRQAEFAAMFGRIEGESDADYRARIMPLISGGLMIPRQRTDEMRKEIEAKANVTPEQSKKLDAAFDKVYTDAIDYANKAIADGVLSPYERNVSGWLEFAGGLGGILNDANAQIGQILSPQQQKTIGQSGFEWGEYLGANAPWEKLNPPPPPPRN